MFPLISAVQEGNVSEVKRQLALLPLATDFLPPSSSPLLACDQGLNALHMAVRYNRVKSAEMILAFAASQDKQLCTGLVSMPNGIDGSTPLLMAIAHVPCHTVGPIKMVRLLLDHSAETDTGHTYNHGGMTPLLQAVLLDLPSVVEDLLVASDRASAPLLASVSFLLTQVVQPTPSAGKGDSLDRLQHHPLQGFNALHIACRDGKVDCARVLLAHSSPEYALVRTATSAGQTPIQLAAQCGHAPIVKLLWQHTHQGIVGDDIFSRSAEGYTCLHYAVIHQHRAVLQVIVDYCGQKEINATTTSGQGALHLAVKSVEVMKILIGHPHINPYLKNSLGLTAFEVALFKKQVLGCRVFLHYITTELTCIPQDVCSIIVDYIPSICFNIK